MTQHYAILGSNLQRRSLWISGPDSSACVSSQDISNFVPWWAGSAEWKHLGWFIYKWQVKSKNSGWGISSENLQRRGKGGFPCVCREMFCWWPPPPTLREDCPSPVLSAQSRCHLCVQVRNEMLPHQRGLERRLRPSVCRPWSMLPSSIMRPEEFFLLCPLSVGFEHRFFFFMNPNKYYSGFVRQHLSSYLHF